MRSPTAAMGRVGEETSFARLRAGGGGTDCPPRRCPHYWSLGNRTMARAHGLFDIDLERQVDDLRKELARLTRSAARHGSNFYGDAGETISDYLADLSGRVAPSLLGLRRRARSVERVAYDHPAVIAGVGLAVVGLVATLLISRRTPRRAVRNRRPVAEDDEVARDKTRRPARANRGRASRNSRASA
jgi:hypothetical protein